MVILRNRAVENVSQQRRRQLPSDGSVSGPDGTAQATAKTSQARASKRWSSPLSSFRSNKSAPMQKHPATPWILAITWSLSLAHLASAQIAATTRLEEVVVQAEAESDEVVQG